MRNMLSIESNQEEYIAKCFSNVSLHALFNFG